MTSPEDNGQGHVDGFDDSDEIDEVVIIIDEDDNEQECLILAVIEHDDGQEYALLSPVDQVEQDDGTEIELFILSIKTDENGDDSFGFIEDEEIYEAVKTVFSTLMEQAE